MSLDFFEPAIKRHMEALAAEERFLGTPGHSWAREYLMRQFISWERQFFTHEFPLALFTPQKGSVTVMSPAGENVGADPGVCPKKEGAHTGAPLQGHNQSRELECLAGVGCPSAEIQAPVLHVGHGCSQDYRPEEAKGKILIASIGHCHETDKVRLASERGAAGLLWYHKDLDEIFSGAAHYEVSPIPALALKPSAAKSLTDGALLKLSITSKKLEMKGQNFYFDLGPYPPRFFLTCHYDSRPQTPGANDNATGVACLLALAQALFQGILDWPQGVGGLRFIFFDAEEVGCQGSEAYAASLENSPEWKDLVGIINLDAIGKERLCAITQDREAALDPYWAQTAQEVFSEGGLDLGYTSTGSGRSDHAPFVRRGKPALWLSSNPNPVRHTVLDDLAHVDMNFMAKVAAGLGPLLSRLAKF